jgi:hypothetical protein
VDLIDICREVAEEVAPGKFNYICIDDGDLETQYSGVRVGCFMRPSSDRDYLRAKFEQLKECITRDWDESKKQWVMNGL